MLAISYFNRLGEGMLLSLWKCCNTVLQPFNELESNCCKFMIIWKLPGSFGWELREVCISCQLGKNWVLSQTVAMLKLSNIVLRTWRNWRTFCLHMNLIAGSTLTNLSSKYSEAIQKGAMSLFYNLECQRSTIPTDELITGINFWGLQWPLL